MKAQKALSHTWRQLCLALLVQQQDSERLRLVQSEMMHDSACILQEALPLGRCSSWLHDTFKILSHPGITMPLAPLSCWHCVQILLRLPWQQWNICRL